jgi:hypothetical protein
MPGRIAALLVVLAVILGPAPAPVAAQEPVLERYSLQVGSPDATGVEASIHDQYLGHGSAESWIRFTAPIALGDPSGTGRLALRVWRTVEPGQITFALLVVRVEVRAYDAGGAVVYAADLPGFTFAESAPGAWRQVLESLPKSLGRLDVVFFGNYQ